MSEDVKRCSLEFTDGTVVAMDWLACNSVGSWHSLTADSMEKIDSWFHQITTLTRFDGHFCGQQEWPDDGRCYESSEAKEKMVRLHERWIPYSQ